MPHVDDDGWWWGGSPEKPPRRGCWFRALAPGALALVTVALVNRRRRRP